jgi:hypothetical protein
MQRQSLVQARRDCKDFAEERPVPEQKSQRRSEDPILGHDCDEVMISAEEERAVREVLLAQKAQIKTSRTIQRALAVMRDEEEKAETDFKKFIAEKANVAQIEELVDGPKWPANKPKPEACMSCVASEMDGPNVVDIEDIAVETPLLRGQAVQQLLSPDVPTPAFSDHVTIEYHGRHFSSRFAAATKYSEKAREVVDQYTPLKLVMTILWILSLLPNSTAYEVLRSAGVVVGNVSKKLLLKLAKASLPRFRVQCLRNLLFVLFLVTQPDLSAAVEDVPQGVYSTVREAHFLLAYNSTNFTVPIDGVAAVPTEPLLVWKKAWDHREECLKFPEASSDCVEVLAFFDRVRESMWIQIPTNVTNGTLNEIERLASMSVAVVRKTDFAIVVAFLLFVLWLVGLSAVVMLARVFVKRQWRFYKLKHAQVKSPARPALRHLKWVSTDPSNVYFDSPNGPLCVSQEDWKRLLESCKPSEKPELETAKPGSLPRKRGDWPVGGVWILKDDGSSNLVDNGGGARVKLPWGEYLVCNLHQLSEHAEGARIFLRGPKGHTVSFVFNRKELITIGVTEIAILRNFVWPQGVACASFAEVEHGMGDNLVGTFHGMENGELFMSSGKVERPRSLDVAHWASTTNGWCGWPGEVGARYVFLHYSGGGPGHPNRCLYIGSVLVALEKAMQRKGKKFEKSKWALENAVRAVKNSAIGQADFEWAEARSGPAEMGLLVTQKSTGKSWLFDENEKQGFEREMRTKKYEQETNDELAARFADPEEYYRDLDREAMYQRTREEQEEDRRKDEEDERDRERARERKTEQESDAEEVAIAMAAHLRGDSRMAQALGLLDSPEGPVSTVRYRCLCGSRKREHDCKKNYNIYDLTKENVAQVLEALRQSKKMVVSVNAPEPSGGMSLEGPSTVQAADLALQQEAERAKRAVAEQEVARLAAVKEEKLKTERQLLEVEQVVKQERSAVQVERSAVQIELSEVRKAVAEMNEVLSLLRKEKAQLLNPKPSQDTKAQDFQTAPPSAPVVAVQSQVSSDKFEGVKESKSKDKKAAKKKRYQQKRDDCLAALSKTGLTGEALQQAVKQAMQAQRVADQKAQSKLEGPQDKRPEVFRMQPEFNQLPWSEPKEAKRQPDDSKETVMQRTCKLKDGSVMLWFSDQPGIYKLLPPRLPSEPKLGPSFASLMERVSTAVTKPGSGSEKPPAIGTSPLPTSTANLIVPPQGSVSRS